MFTISYIFLIMNQETSQKLQSALETYLVLFILALGWWVNRGLLPFSREEVIIAKEK